MRTITRFVWIFILAGCAGETSNLKNAPQSQSNTPASSYFFANNNWVEYPTANPVDLGNGWSLLKSEKTGDVCIEFVEKSLTYQDINMGLSIIEDKESYLKKTSASIGAKFKGIFGSGKAKSSVDVVKSTKVDSKSSFVAVDAQVDNGPSYVAPSSGSEGLQRLITESQSAAQRAHLVRSLSVSVRLKEEFVELASNDIEEFFSRCGESYVSVIHSGGRLFGSLRFAETSRLEKEKIKSHVSGSSGGFSFSADFQNEMEEFEQSGRFNLSFYAGGGSGVRPPTNKSQLLEVVRDYPENVKKGPKPIWMITEKYDELWNWPADPIDEILAGPKFELLSIFLQVSHLKAMLDDIISDEGSSSSGNWISYYDIDIRAMRSLRNNLVGDLDELKRLAENCQDDAACSLGPWEGWTDWELRTQLPAFDARLDKRDLWCANYTVDINRSNAYMARDMRYQDLIFQADNYRCGLFNRCLDNQEHDRLRSDVEDRVFFGAHPTTYLPSQCLELVANEPVGRSEDCSDSTDVSVESFGREDEWGVVLFGISVDSCDYSQGSFEFEMKLVSDDGEEQELTRREGFFMVNESEQTVEYRFFLGDDWEIDEVSEPFDVQCTCRAE